MAFVLQMTPVGIFQFKSLQWDLKAGAKFIKLYTKF